MWNTWTPVPEFAGVLLAHAKIERSLVLRTISALFREGPVFLSVRFSSGEEVTYRITADNAEGGLWVSPFVESIGELESLFRGVPSRRATAIRFSAGMFGGLYQPVMLSWTDLAPRGEHRH